MEVLRVKFFGKMKVIELHYWSTELDILREVVREILVRECSIIFLKEKKQENTASNLFDSIQSNSFCTF